jgi:hypothetical protein
MPIPPTRDLDGNPARFGLAGLLFAQTRATNGCAHQIGLRRSTWATGLGPVLRHGRINALRAVTNDRSATTPPGGLFSDSATASGYAHARKLARDPNGTLNLVWHTKEGNQYRVRYALSQDDGASWQVQPDVFASTQETYHPAMVVDSSYVYVALPANRCLLSVLSNPSGGTFAQWP